VNQRRHVTLVAAGATLLAALPLATVFDRWTWMVDAVIAVGAIAGVALLVRTLRVPPWAPTLAMSAGFVVILTWIFHSGHEFAGLIPTPSTLGHWNDLLLSAGRDMREMGVPVEDRDGLLFLSTLGVGGVAILVDLFAVVLRRPALAGLPMLAIYSVPVAVHTDSVNFIPFVAGAAGFLWLLVTDNVDRVRRFGRRFTGDGRDVDLWEPSPLAAAGRRLALVGVLLAVLLPVAVPGMTGGLLERFGTGGTGSGGPGGSGASVDLFANLSGALIQEKPFDMVRVETNDSAPQYLRFGVADEISANGFRNRPARGGQAVTAGFPDPTIGPVAGVSQHRYHANVQILNFDMRLLPIYVQPTKTGQLDSAWAYDPKGEVIYSGRATTKGKRYSFDYLHIDYTADALRTAGPLSPNDPIQKQYAQLPTQIQRVTDLVAQLTKGMPTQYDKVRAIYDYFSAANGFTYSQQTKRGTSGSDIVDFLHSKQGFCEQYSAAMAWLVRAAGFPSRVAFGFTKGSNQRGNTYTLTNLNLHAWTEVYFDRFGWVPFDTTPANGIPGAVRPAWAPDPDKTGGPGSNDVDPGLKPGQAPSADPNASASPGADPHGAGGGEGPAGPPEVRLGLAALPVWLFWTLLSVVVLVVLLFMPALARVLLRRRRRPDRVPVPAGPPMAVAAGIADPSLAPIDTAAAEAARRQAHAAWDELIDTLVDHKIEMDHSETPRALTERLGRSSMLTAEPAERARLIGRAEERARYARNPLVGSDLAAALRAVRRAIRERVSLRTRLRASLLPPSTVERWRIAAINGSTAAALVVGRWRDRVYRVVNPRQLMAGRGTR
jgi:transglutaminase-like putative cysteine protease